MKNMVGDTLSIHELGSKTRGNEWVVRQSYDLHTLQLRLELAVLFAF